MGGCNTCYCTRNCCNSICFSEIHTIIKYRCPACKKIDALMITRKLINEENISIKVQLENRNNSGEIVGHSEQYIPGVRKLMK